LYEKKEPTDDTATDVYSQLVRSRHVSGIIMPIVRRTDSIKTNRSQHIQANTTHGFIHSFLLMIGIMKPETC